MEKHSYGYHPDYFYFTSIQPCVEDPDNPGTFIHPGDTTLISPPEVDSNQVAIFNKDTNSWSISENMGGEWYNIDTIMTFINYDLGKKPENATRKKPPIDHIPDLEFDYENDEWIIDIKFDPDTAPRSHIFPETLPSPFIDYDPVYSQELGRWTFTSTSSPFVGGDDQGQFLIDNPSKDDIFNRLQILETSLDKIRELFLDANIMDIITETNTNNTGIDT